MNAKIIMIYWTSLLIFLSIVYLPIQLVSITMTGHLLVLTFPLLFLTCWKSFKKSRHFTLVMLYFAAILISMTLVQKVSFATFPRYASPLLIIASLEDKERKYFKPIFYLLLIFFVVNCIIALIERASLTHIISYDLDNSMFGDQVLLGELNDNSFRSFAMLGHPLWNANIMSFMSFMFYNCFIIKRRYRIYLLILGYLSLFCFNARAAIIVSTILLAPTIKNYISKSQHKTITVLMIFVCFIYFVMHFSQIGGRLLEDGIDDGSTMVRVYSIKEFFSIPFSQLLVGGYKYQYGENGYLEILMTYGLIVGGFKIVSELFLGLKFISNKSKVTKWIIFLSVILIGCTNNNFNSFRVFPFYLLCLAFIENYGTSVKLKQQNK